MHDLIVAILMAWCILGLIVFLLHDCKDCHPTTMILASGPIVMFAYLAMSITGKIKENERGE